MKKLVSNGNVTAVGFSVLSIADLKATLPGTDNDQTSCSQRFALGHPTTSV
jgi:hypothetical protein